MGHEPSDCFAASNRFRRRLLEGIAGSVVRLLACAWTDSAPAFIKATPPDGAAFSTEKVRGHVLLLNSWATCAARAAPRCQESMPTPRSIAHKDSLSLP